MFHAETKCFLVKTFKTHIQNPWTYYLLEIVHSVRSEIPIDVVEYTHNHLIEHLHRQCISTEVCNNFKEVDQTYTVS